MVVRFNDAKSPITLFKTMIKRLFFCYIKKKMSFYFSWPTNNFHVGEITHKLLLARV